MACYGRTRHCHTRRRSRLEILDCGADVSRLRLTFACGRYDRMEALRTGEVTVEGIDLNYLAIWP
jgi:hypothetical protein